MGDNDRSYIKESCFVSHFHAIKSAIDLHDLLFVNLRFSFQFKENHNLYNSQTFIVFYLLKYSHRIMDFSYKTRASERKHSYLAPGGGCDVLFSPGLSVCLSVCLCVCLSVCRADILVFYFSVIRRDIDLKCIQETYSSIH